MAASAASSKSSEEAPARNRRRSGDPRKRTPAKKRYGSETPRIWTRPLRPLTPKTSHGFAVIEFAEEILELQLLPWQKWLLIHALETRLDGSLRFRNVVVLVARQNGKSTLSQVLALYWLYVLHTRTVLGTAQDLDTAEDVWEGAVEIAQETEVLADEIAKVIRVNGKKALLLEGGQRYRVKAANRRAGRGLTGDRILLDELREHQTWDAWGAITKDLANSTPILRANGTWSTIGQLAVGDQVFGPAGRPVRVDIVHPIADLRPMYRITTSDRRSVIASESHLWTVKDTRKSYDLSTGWETLTTKEILDRGLLRQGKGLAFRLPHQEALVGLPEKPLPLDPYVLGAWLGDGTSADGTITVGDADLQDTRRELQQAGATVTSEVETRSGVWRVRLHVGGHPLRPLLREMGLLSAKHVPAEYETACYAQRLALLQGLLDSDGCVTRAGCIRFTSTQEHLADSVLFLARSLGWTAWKKQVIPTLNGKACSPAWLITFTHRVGDPIPFRLPRKAAACEAASSPRGRLLTSIASIERVASEPSTCIGVGSDDHLFLAGRDLIPTHNTTMARPDAQVWCLSNAGDMTSVVLRYLRMKAHAALGDPDGLNAAEEPEELLPGDDELDEMADRDVELEDADVTDFEVDEDDLAIFEWSAPPDCSIWDRDAWALANPSMGYTIQERTIASAARTDPEWIFRTEVLCQWSEGGLEGPFPSGTWEKCDIDRDDEKRPKPGQGIADGSRVDACLDVSWNRSAAYIAVCGDRADGLPQVELAAQRYGTDWVIEWLCDPAKPTRAKWRIAIQVGSPAWSLRDDLVDAGLKVVEWKGTDVSSGTGTFYDEVRDGKVRHRSQPALNQAAGTARVKLLGGGASVIDRKASPRDAAPLIAAIGARWLHAQKTKQAPPPPPPPQAVKATDVTPARGSIATAGF